MKKILPVIYLIGMCSCAEQSRLAKHTILYHFPFGGGSDSVNKYKVDDKPNVQVEERNGHLVIRFVDDHYALASPTAVPIRPPTGFTASMALSNEYYFAESSDKAEQKKSLTYYSRKFQLQAISVPFKFRKAIKNDPRILDSLPSQVETGFTVGFAAGEKFSLNIFNSKKNLLGSYVNRYSIYPGAFVNLGTTTLKRLTTKDAITFDQTVPLFSYGAYLMLGFNSINIGYNIGFDHPLNRAGKDWVYQGKLWQGITLGLDILK